MRKEYIPVMVEVNGKKELWRLDVTNLSVTELIHLKEELLSFPYSKTIQALDSLIKSDIETIIPSNKINCGSYMREYKRTKKEEYKKRKIKNIRRKYDKHKR